MEELIEKRCGEIYLTIYGTTIFFCSLCENKYECYEDYAEHLNDQHIIMETEILETDPETDNLETSTEALEEHESHYLNAEEDNTQSTHFVECGDPIQDLNDEEKFQNEIEVEEIKPFQPIETIESITICPKSEIKITDEDSSCETASDNQEEEFTKRPVAPTYIRSKTDRNKFQCPYCEHATADKCNLRRHIDRHLKYKPYKCTECGKAFSTRSELNTHILTHTGERPFVCEICGFGLTTSSARKKHMRRRHKTELQNVKISIAIEDGKENSTIIKNNQSKVMHNEVNVLPLRITKFRETTEERKFQCPHCYFASTTIRNLRIHIKRHFSKKPHKCMECGKGFHTRAEMRAHFQTHTEEHPYLCTQCGMAFKTTCKLKNHLQRHEKNRDKICSICYKQFFDEKSLREHVTIHSEEMETLLH